MVDLAKRCGADCVKFQLRNMQKVYRHKSLMGAGDDLGTEYVIDLLRKFELSVKNIYRYVNTVNMKAYCTCVLLGTN